MATVENNCVVLLSFYYPFNYFCTSCTNAYFSVQLMLICAVVS